MKQADCRVEFPYLVVPTQTALPLRCVKTNLPVTEHEYQVMHLPYMPTWLVVLAIMMPIMLIASPFLMPNKCQIKVGYSAAARRRNLLLKAALLITSLFGLVLVPIMMTIGSEAGALAAFAYLPLISYPCFVYLILGTSPLVVQEHRQGLSWIRGCSPEFLASLREPTLIPC